MTAPIRSGVSFPAYGATATFALATGTPDSDFPVANLADLVNIREVCKASGALVITAVLTASQTVGFVGLLHHNGTATDTMRVQLYSDAGLTAQVADSGVLTLADSVRSRYVPCMPWAPVAAVTARSVKITLSSRAWIIGAVEIAGFWEFKDVEVATEIGFINNDSVVPGLDGVDFVTKIFSPRTFKGSRGDAVNISETTALDFVMAKGRHTPFVWVWDADDPTTFSRQCFVARNLDTVPLVKLKRPSQRVNLSFREHFG